MLEYLGNVVGGSSYFGACAKCGSQFMSTHDRVVVLKNERGAYVGMKCEKCAKGGK